MTPDAFRLGDEIGRGALGRVVRVYDGESRVYAAKILHPSHQEDERARARFASEAAILAEVQHENIVRVYGLETIEGQTAMRMELVDGSDLATHLAIHGPLKAAELIAIASGVSAGLRAAHGAGLVHRDLKPHNILLGEDGVPKIADFGMARAASFAGVDESAFAVAGTPDYMAPECIDPLAVDARSDLYSFGCILFELATGHPPFSGATAFAVLEAHRSAPIPALDETMPAALTAIISELLAKSPADRPQSAASVSTALAEIASGDQAALVRTSDTSLIAAGRCASCGQWVHPTLSVCFGCGEASISLEPGQHTVFVHGPGQIGDKLDAALRLALLAWLDSNPNLGLDAKPLAKRVPRLPIVIATKLSDGSARALARAIESIGLQCTVQRGGRFALPAARKKSWLLGKRLLAIGAATSVVMVGHIGLSIVSIATVLVVGGAGGGLYLGGRGVTRRRRIATSSVPDTIAESLSGVAQVVGDIQQKRHREGLRAVVERVLSLCESLPAAILTECESDLAKLIDIALVACARMDKIDEQVIDADMRNPAPATLTLLRERDRWAGQLLEATAFLDSLRVRSAALHHANPQDDASTTRIDELRAHIAALEEVQAL